MRKTEEEEWRTLLLLRLLLGSFHTQFFFHLIQEYRGRLPASRVVVGRGLRPCQFCLFLPTCVGACFYFTCAQSSGIFFTEFEENRTSLKFEGY